MAYLVQAVRAAGKCDAVFKGFSDCLLKLGDSMANYPQGLDDKTNIKTVCTILGGFPQLHGHSSYGLPGRGERYVG
ncbi:Neuritin [Apodemus speciosus]|uniref:Neuritin n=1 Tax=Apodemus speciosus TaxID=105296 RepID=A0ABQ0FFS1_APOSI